MKNSDHKFEEIKEESKKKPDLRRQLVYLEAHYDLAVDMMHCADRDKKDSLFCYYVNLSSRIGAYHKKLSFSTIKPSKPLNTPIQTYRNFLNFK